MNEKALNLEADVQFLSQVRTCTSRVILSCSWVLVENAALNFDFKYVLYRSASFYSHFRLRWWSISPSVRSSFSSMFTEARLSRAVSVFTSLASISCLTLHLTTRLNMSTHHLSTSSNITKKGNKLVRSWPKNRRPIFKLSRTVIVLRWMGYSKCCRNRRKISVKARLSTINGTLDFQQSLLRWTAAILSLKQVVLSDAQDGSCHWKMLKDFLQSLWWWILNKKGQWCLVSNETTMLFHVTCSYDGEGSTSIFYWNEMLSRSYFAWRVYCWRVKKTYRWWKVTEWWTGFTAKRCCTTDTKYGIAGPRADSVSTQPRLIGF